MHIETKTLSILQAMGIDVYHHSASVADEQDADTAPQAPAADSDTPSHAAISQKSWFPDLIALLKLDVQQCKFSDTAPISFDSVTKSLVLPATLAVDDAKLKREIWDAIKGELDELA
ncbi:hypothetical protein PN836_000245 [Ningiella sp. W23]|uniref:hypothetical protein n=1 Tax=Ningiella sp. W23 TaxID=3023715 RepID=UPI003756992F